MQKSLRLLSFASLLTVTIAVPAAAVMGEADAAPRLERAKHYRQDELLVKFHPGTTAQQAQGIAAAAGAVEARSFQRPRRTCAVPVHFRRSLPWW